MFYRPLLRHNCRESAQSSTTVIKPMFSYVLVGHVQTLNIILFYNQDASPLKDENVASIKSVVPPR